MKYWMPFFIAVLLGCDRIPQDPRRTFRDAQTSRPLRVGVIHEPPWADTKSRPFSGREVELVKKFAEENQINIRWQATSTLKGIQDVEKYEIDVLIGGLEKTLPFKRVGATRPYFQDHLVVVARGENRLLVELEKFLKRNAKQMVGSK